MRADCASRFRCASSIAAHRPLTAADGKPFNAIRPHDERAEVSKFRRSRSPAGKPNIKKLSYVKAVQPYQSSLPNPKYPGLPVEVTPSMKIERLLFLASSITSSGLFTFWSFT